MTLKDFLAKIPGYFSFRHRVLLKTLKDLIDILSGVATERVVCKKNITEQDFVEEYRQILTELTQELILKEKKKSYIYVLFLKMLHDIRPESERSKKC